MMNILYVNVIEQNAGWGAETFVNRGFRRNGVQTITLDYRKYRNCLGAKFREIHADFDALFLQRGDGFPLDLLRAVNRPRFFWASELISRNRDQDRLLSSKLFDHIFVRTHACRLSAINRFGLVPQKVSILLSGFDEVVQYKIPDSPKDIDVLFVGTVKGLPRRDKILKAIGNICPVTIKSAFGPEMTALFNRSKIVLNIHSEEFLDTETRVYEALGCGAFLISEKLSSENPFIPGKHYVEVNDITDMAEKVKYFLAHEDERMRIAEDGHAEALSKHTYTHRAAEIGKVFEPYIGETQTPAINSEILKKYAAKEKLIKPVAVVGVRLRAYLRGLLRS